MIDKSCPRALWPALAAAVLMACPAQADEDAAVFNFPTAPAFSGDGWSFKTFGRVQYDHSQADADSALGFDVNDEEWRRVRLGFQGKFGSRLSYKAEWNTNSSGDINVEDAFIEFTPTDGPVKVKIGQYKTPNSLDEQTSSRFISVFERAAFTDAFGFNRRLGVSINAKSDRYSFSAGVFGNNLEDDNATNGMALAARLTLTPIQTDDLAVHLGASTRYREQGSSEGPARYRQRPFTHIPGRIVSTGNIGGSDTFFGFEAAAMYQKFWTATEYGKLIAERDTSTADPEFDGGYVEAGAFIGGRKGYKGGKFDRPTIDDPITKGGFGAVSLVARYDTLDLRGGGVDGGKLDTLTAGAEWWPTSHIHIGVNYFRTDASLGTVTSGLDSNFAALVTAGVTDETVDGFTVRAQFDF